jgi:hypothetical protein
MENNEIVAPVIETVIETVTETTTEDGIRTVTKTVTKTVTNLGLPLNEETDLFKENSTQVMCDGEPL